MKNEPSETSAVFEISEVGAESPCSAKTFVAASSSDARLSSLRGRATIREYILSYHGWQAANPPEPPLCRCCASYADIGITSIPREVRNDLREKAFGKPRPSDIIFELFRHSGFFEDCLPGSLRLAGAAVNALVGGLMKSWLGKLSLSPPA